MTEQREKGGQNERRGGVGGEKEGEQNLHIVNVRELNSPSLPFLPE